MIIMNKKSYLLRLAEHHERLSVSFREAATYEYEKPVEYPPVSMDFPSQLVNSIEQSIYTDGSVDELYKTVSSFIMSNLLSLEGSDLDLIKKEAIDQIDERLTPVFGGSVTSEAKDILEMAMSEYE